ncbi:MAG: hypothetical protein WCP55_02705, partial [Lentisphaerota bacterium]
MINNFKDNEAQNIFSFEFSRKLPPDIQQKALMKLKSIDYAAELRDLARYSRRKSFLTRLSDKDGLVRIAPELKG